MRMSKVHKVVVTAVVTTIAAATVLTFTRGDSASADRFASLPHSANDSPVVASRTPGTTTKATSPSPSATTPSPTRADPTTKAPRPSTTTSGNQPSAPITRPSEPAIQPTRAPSPTPREKNILEILLGL